MYQGWHNAAVPWFLSPGRDTSISGSFAGYFHGEGGGGGGGGQ